MALRSLYISVFVSLRHVFSTTDMNINLYQSKLYLFLFVFLDHCVHYVITYPLCNNIFIIMIMIDRYGLFKRIKLSPMLQF